MFVLLQVTYENDSMIAFLIYDLQKLATQEYKKVEEEERDESSVCVSGVQEG